MPAKDNHFTLPDSHFAIIEDDALRIFKTANNRLGGRRLTEISIGIDEALNLSDWVKSHYDEDAKDADSAGNDEAPKKYHGLTAAHVGGGWFNIVDEQGDILNDVKIKGKDEAEALIADLVE